MKRAAIGTSAVLALLALVAAVVHIARARERPNRMLRDGVNVHSLYSCVQRFMSDTPQRDAVHTPQMFAPRLFSPGLPDEREFSVIVYSDKPDETMQAWFYVLNRSADISSARRFYREADMDKLVVYSHRNVIVTSSWIWTAIQHSAIHSCLD